jgi:hypothetical protein
MESLTMPGRSINMQAAIKQNREGAHHFPFKTKSHAGRPNLFLLPAMLIPSLEI